jgi:hypothetical protein
MKKHLNITTVILFSISILFSCKKSSTSAPPPAVKDYAASVKDKTWLGKFAYTGKAAEYYSVHFNTDNTLTWSQSLGDYTGHWVINGKTLTITFDANTSQIKGDITDDDKLMNIVVANTNAYSVNSSQLSSNTNLPLDNTAWKGTIVIGAGQGIYQTNFLPGLQVEATIGANPAGKFAYTRSASGAIRFSTGGAIVFGIVISATEMEGSYGSSTTNWRAIKQ